MTLPSSGYMSLDMIRNEFGGAPLPVYLSQYYAGGGRVPPGISGVNGPIPSSGYLSLAHFYGASNYVPPPIIDTQNLSAGRVSSFGQVTVGFTSGTMSGHITPIGGISDGAFDPFGGAPIMQIVQDNTAIGGGIGTSPVVRFMVQGTFGNGGFTKMIVEGVREFPRSAISNFLNYTWPPATTLWEWAIGGGDVIFSNGGNYTIHFQ